MTIYRIIKRIEQEGYQDQSQIAVIQSDTHETIQ
jgi:hypothetical protein